MTKLENIGEVRKKQHTFAMEAWIKDGKIGPMPKKLKVKELLRHIRELQDKGFLDENARPVVDS